MHFSICPKLNFLVQKTGKDWGGLQSWVKCLQAENKLCVLPTSAVVKSCVPVSAIDSPNDGGTLELRLYEPLTHQFCWAMPLEAQWGGKSHGECLEESAQCMRPAVMEQPLDSTLCFGSWGETLVWSTPPSQVHCQFCIQDQDRSGKIIPSFFQLPVCQNSFQSL